MFHGPSLFSLSNIAYQQDITEVLHVNNRQDNNICSDITVNLPKTVNMDIFTSGKFSIFTISHLLQKFPPCLNYNIT